MISILITVGDMAEERRAPVLAAVRENLENAAVQAVHVLTEGNPVWLPDAMGALAERLHMETVAERPTFGMLFTTANHLLEQGAECIAIMNADVSIPKVEDVARLHAAFDCLADLPAPVVFTLARHEQIDGRRSIELFDDAGLPNYISADAWVFRTPLHPPRELFYCPGQMNCDMFLANDLIDAGYHLFNPCFDVTLLHHEPMKDNEFYTEKNKEQGVQDLMQRYARQNSIYTFNYHGVPWISSEWLKAGYRPRPLNTHGRSFIVLVDDLETGFSENALGTIAYYCEAHDRQCQIVYSGAPQDFFDRYGGALAQFPRITVSPAQRPLDFVRGAYLRGKQYGANSVAFLADLSFVSYPILVEADCIFISLGRHSVPPQGELFGCTLVTSVFRSDAFLAGFIRNSAALTGYGNLIDHIFLVSKLSDLEADLLNGMLAEHPNAMVFWNREDPGLYNCWNQGIRLARRRYVSNANVDDLRDPDHVVTLMEDLESNPDVLVAATAVNPFDVYPDDGSLPQDRPGWYADRAGRFGMFDIAYLSEDDPAKLVPYNMPHCMPVWRRSLHMRFGWFDEARYGTYADWAFWLKVLRSGAYGWINPAPIGFYFVNPESHNRRGTDLERLHAVVEEDFIGMFLARRNGRLAHVNSTALPSVPPKLQLGSHDLFMGDHRNSFHNLIDALKPLAQEQGKVRFEPFLERYFVWGNSPGEAASSSPAPITQEWVGILHVPFDAPQWFNPEVSPEVFFETDLWRASRPHCRGIITLAADLAADLQAHDPELPVLSVRHPVELDVRMFDFPAYCARPRVVQVGDWLRKLQAIHRLDAPGHERVMLMKKHTNLFLGREIEVMGDHRDPAVDVRSMVPNDEYDRLLSSAVVLCLMYHTAANNVVIECIARATPILVNPLAAVVEYLGPDYPLYARDEEEAALLLLVPDRIEAAHRYLLSRRQEIDLSYGGFCRDIAESGWYSAL